jgi:hypothetical protein
MTAQLVNVPGPSGKIILKLDLLPEPGSSESPSLSFIFKGPKGLQEREAVKTFIAARMGDSSATPSISRQTSEKGIPPVMSGSSSGGRLRNEEIQARQALLLKDRHLAQLHRDWVVQGGLISEEEFWETRKVCFCFLSLSDRFSKSSCQ